MKYYFTISLKYGFEETVSRTREALKQEGFGIVSEIDMQSKFKEKLGKAFKKYTILGACNPAYAFEAIQAEQNIGTMLPCNFVVIEQEEGITEVVAIDPLASMMAVENPQLKKLASQVTSQIEKIIHSLK